MHHDDIDGEETEISPFNLLVLKALTRLTFQEEIDDESIELLREMELEYDSLLKKYSILSERVNLDEKTSLLKYNEEFLVNIIKMASRYWHSSKCSPLFSISYLRLDLDDFSRINNRYGHDIGDRVLVQVAETLKHTTRPTDYVFRFGGEEFDIVLPATPLDGAKVCAEKILDGIRNIRIQLPAGELLRITASLGLSQFDHDLNDGLLLKNDRIAHHYQQVQREADRACYAAKHGGKDRWSVFDQSIDYDRIMREYSSRH